MSLNHKIRQRLSDPVFYEKRFRDFVRPFRKFRDNPKYTSLADSPVSNADTALLVIAHPDDEVFCSGLLLQLVESGCEIIVACVTRGEGGPTGNGVTREKLGEIREKEMRASCEKLGIHELRFMGHIDPVAKGYRVFAPDVSAKQLAEQLRPFLTGVDLVISHGSNGEYWHAAHLLVHKAVRIGLSDLHQNEKRLCWLTMLARQPDHAIPKMINWDDEADISLDVSALHEKRLSAFECHATQLKLFEKFARGTHIDFITKTARENYRLGKANEGGS